MNDFWILILLFFAPNLLDKAAPIPLEETPLKIIDEIFGKGWWDNDKAEEWHKLTLEQNFHDQIIRQNTQIGQIKPNSTDQNPTLTEFDHSDNAKNGEEQNEIIKEITSNERRKIVDKFHAIKEEIKQKGKFPRKKWNQIEQKIGKYLKVNRSKIFEWKKEFGLNQKVFYDKEERKHLIEKFDQRKAELMQAGFKNSYSNQIDKIVAKDLSISDTTIYRWKREGQIAQNKYSHRKELMKLYYEIKDQNPKIRDEDIAKSLNISRVTLYNWKKQFKQQQLHPNSADGHSVEENAAANVQEIGNSNSGSI